MRSYSESASEVTFENSAYLKCYYSCGSSSGLVVHKIQIRPNQTCFDILNYRKGLLVVHSLLLFQTNQNKLLLNLSLKNRLNLY